MTVQEFLEDLYEASGNETKLYPYDGTGAFDLTVAGSVRMLGWLNRGYKLLSKMKTANGTPIRFSSVEAELFFQTVTVTGTATAGDTATITLDETDAADTFNGWLICIDDGTGAGQIRLIVDWDGSDATVHYDWDTEPDETSEYTLYKRHMRLANSADADAAYHITMPTTNGVVNVLKIEDVKDGRELNYAGRTESFPGNIVATGIPLGYVRYGNTLYFDVAPNEARWYRMEYEKELSSLTTSTDEPEIPEQWQEILWLWLVWKARTWAFEPNAAYGAKRDFTSFMESIQLPSEMEFERQDAHLEVEIE